MLRPFISAENYWILNHHEIFQARVFLSFRSYVYL